MNTPLKDIIARCEGLFEDLRFASVQEWKAAAPGRKPDAKAKKKAVKKTAASARKKTAQLKARAQKSSAKPAGRARARKPARRTRK